MSLLSLVFWVVGFSLVIAGLVVCGFWVVVVFGWCLRAFLPAVVAIVYVVLISILFGGCKWLYFAFVGGTMGGGLRVGLLYLVACGVVGLVVCWRGAVLGGVWLLWEVVAGLSGGVWLGL